MHNNSTLEWQYSKKKEIHWYFFSMRVWIWIMTQQSFLTNWISVFLVSVHLAKTCTGGLPILGNEKERGRFKYLDDAKLRHSARITAGIRRVSQKLKSCWNMFSLTYTASWKVLLMNHLKKVKNLIVCLICLLNSNI